MVTVAILVLNFNGRALLENCFASVMAWVGTRANVYLVDNGSTDGSVEYTRERFSSVRVIAFNQNLGFAGAYDKAVKQVHEDIVIFLNNDVEVTKDWFELLVGPIESGSNEQLAICGSKILLFYDQKRVNHAGGILLPIGGGLDIDFLKIDQGEPTGPRFVGCVSGASMAVRRSVFLELGGFDEDFFAYFEDVDFCWRAWLAGYKVMLAPTSILYHKVGASWGSHLNPERVFMGERNRLQCLLKNLETRNVVLGLFVSTFYIALRVGIYLRLHAVESVFAIARAYWWVFRNFRQLAIKRRQVQSRRLVGDSFFFRRGLMTSYYQGLVELVRRASYRRRYSYLLASGTVPYSPRKS
jgi:GT2 family glycosyltransferase